MLKLLKYFLQLLYECWFSLLVSIIIKICLYYIFINNKICHYYFYKTKTHLNTFCLNVLLHTQHIITYYISCQSSV